MPRTSKNLTVARLPIYIVAQNGAGEVARAKFNGTVSSALVEVFPENLTIAVQRMRRDRARRFELSNTRRVVIGSEYQLDRAHRRYVNMQLADQIYDVSDDGSLVAEETPI